jgi:hypothetical protein
VTNDITAHYDEWSARGVPFEKMPTVDRGRAGHQAAARGPDALLNPLHVRNGKTPVRDDVSCAKRNSPPEGDD